jgi:hypothetical protein
VRTDRVCVCRPNRRAHKRAGATRQPVNAACPVSVNRVSGPASHQPGIPLDRDESTDWLLDRSTRLGLEYLRNRLSGRSHRTSTPHSQASVTNQAKRASGPAWHCLSLEGETVVHRLLPTIIVVALLCLLVSHHPARAGKAWCLSDPILELNGQVLDVQAYAYVNDNQIEDSEYVFTVAPGSSLRVLDPGPDQTIAVYVVSGEANSVTYRVIDSPMVNLKLTVTARTTGPATSAEVQDFGRAIAVAWPNIGGTVASDPMTVETLSLTPVPTATNTPTAAAAQAETATVVLNETSTKTATQAATESAPATATETEAETAVLTETATVPPTETETAVPTQTEIATEVPTEPETATAGSTETETAAVAPAVTATQAATETATTAPTETAPAAATETLTTEPTINTATTEPVDTDLPAR